jgi:hypothetical protein
MPTSGSLQSRMLMHPTFSGVKALTRATCTFLLGVHGVAGCCCKSCCTTKGRGCAGGVALLKVAGVRGGFYTRLYKVVARDRAGQACEINRQPRHCLRRQPVQPPPPPPPLSLSKSNVLSCKVFASSSEEVPRILLFQWRATQVACLSLSLSLSFCCKLQPSHRDAGRRANWCCGTASSLRN